MYEEYLHDRSHGKHRNESMSTWLPGRHSNLAPASSAAYRLRPRLQVALPAGPRPADKLVMSAMTFKNWAIGHCLVSSYYLLSCEPDEVLLRLSALLCLRIDGTSQVTPRTKTVVTVTLCANNKTAPLVVMVRSRRNSAARRTGGGLFALLRTTNTASHSPLLFQIPT